MKNKLLTPFAAAALAALSGATAAQSSVTLGGVADAAVRMVRNEGVGSVKSVISGGNATSRLIVRGSEDLGGGLSAGFHLEHGIALDTGSASGGAQFWDRRSTIASRPWTRRAALIPAIRPCAAASSYPVVPLI